MNEYEEAAIAAALEESTAMMKTEGRNIDNSHGREDRDGGVEMIEGIAAKDEATAKGDVHVVIMQNQSPSFKTERNTGSSTTVLSAPSLKRPIIPDQCVPLERTKASTTSGAHGHPDEVATATASSSASSSPSLMNRILTSSSVPHMDARTATHRDTETPQPLDTPEKSVSLTATLPTTSPTPSSSRSTDDGTRPTLFECLFGPEIVSTYRPPANPKRRKHDEPQQQTQIQHQHTTKTGGIGHIPSTFGGMRRRCAAMSAYIERQLAYLAYHSTLLQGMIQDGTDNATMEEEEGIRKTLKGYDGVSVAMRNLGKKVRVFSRETLRN